MNWNVQCGIWRRTAPLTIVFALACVEASEGTPDVGGLVARDGSASLADRGSADGGALSVRDGGDAESGDSGQGASIQDAASAPDSGFERDADVTVDAGPPSTCSTVAPAHDGVATSIACTATADCPGYRQICRAGLCYEQEVHPGARPARALPPVTPGDATPINRWPDPQEEWRICSFADTPRMLYPTRDACGVCPRDIFALAAGGNNGNHADICVGDVVAVAHYDNNRRARGFDLGTYELVGIAQCGNAPLHSYQARVRRGTEDYMVGFDALTMLAAGDTASRRRTSWRDTSAPVEKYHDLYVVGDRVPLYRQNRDRAVVDYVTITAVTADGWPAAFSSTNPDTTITYIRGVYSARMCTLFESYCVGDRLDRASDAGRAQGIVIHGVVVGGRPDAVVGKIALEWLLVRCDANATTGCFPADDGHYYAEVAFSL
jgi:hypothetical protein